MQVMALVNCPTLMDQPNVGSMFKEDVIARAKTIVDAVKVRGGNIRAGCYIACHSKKLQAPRFFIWAPAPHVSPCA